MSSPSSVKFKGYVIGFLLSLTLTLVAFVLVDRQVFNGRALVAALVSLALAQLSVQFVFFLHLAEEPPPRWNLLTLGFMAGVLIILVFGSLWIMYSLNYNHRGMTNPQPSDTYIINDEGFHNH